MKLKKKKKQNKTKNKKQKIRFKIKGGANALVLPLEAAWPSGQRVGLAIRPSRARVPP